MPQPKNPKIYHIIHTDRLRSVIKDGGLFCDAEMNKRDTSGSTIGMSRIKERRLSLPVACHSGDYVGDYVPFYFCARSVMLYVIQCANNPDLEYTGGQEPIIHLEADLKSVIEWANAHNKRWAFSLSNAGASYTEFRSRVDQLNELKWNFIASTDFRPRDIQEGKQAEFLFHHYFPLELFERIGVMSAAVAQQVANMMITLPHKPKIEIQRNWYY